MKMTRILAGIILTLVAATAVFAQTTKQAAAVSAASPDALAEVRSAIDRGNAQWSEGWARGDAAMVASIFAEDGVQLSGTGKLIKGRQQIMERQKTAMAGADPGVKVTVTTTNVWLDGDTAYETGKYKYEYTEKGKPGKDEGRYITIWKRQKDGSWKLAMDMGVPQD
jgi:uncharacterized protein (TIGR02246 family)